MAEGGRDFYTEAFIRAGFGDTIPNDPKDVVLPKYLPKFKKVWVYYYRKQVSNHGL